MTRVAVKGFVISLWVAFAASVLPRSDAASRELELVAVLEIDLQSKRVNVQEAQFITDAVRKDAAEGLDRSRYLVMTRENMDMIVPPEQRQCLNGMCYAEIGKRLQARVVVGGNVRDFGDQFGVTIEAYESNTGAVLGVEQGEARGLPALLALVREMAPRLLRRVLGGAAAVPPPPPGSGSCPSGVEVVGEVHPEVGILRVEGSPKGARVDLEGPRGFGDKGRLATALPYGPAEVPAGEYRIGTSAPGYDPDSRTVFVPSDKTVVVEVALVQSDGVLEVTGSPQGAKVELTCGRGFQKVFGLPGTLTVPKGTCRVTVSRVGWTTFERDVTVEGGKTARVEVKLT